MKKCALVLVVWLSLVVSAFAITSPNERLADPALEARAVELSKKLRCVVCQNESVEESHADLAYDIRTIVRLQIKAGSTDEQVLNFLRARYGDYILLDPPFVWRTVFLWTIPGIVFWIAAYLAIPLLKRKRRAKKKRLI